MTCVTTVSYSILINGVPIVPFNAKRDLRQGDPLSPYFFVLSMEYLNRQLQALKNQLDFNIHPKCGKLSIAHLGFADDLLLFSKGDLTFILMIYEYFNVSCNAFGLVTNNEKSFI